MALDSKHPDYVLFQDDWVTMRHLFQGERVVKQQRDRYLPPTPSMVLDGMTSSTMVGYQNYENYLKRAYFPDYVQEGVKALVGMLNHKPATIEIPDKMKDLMDRCTLSGESLPGILRRIHAEQLITGRVGLLADLPTDPDPTNPLPYIALYVAESIINWDDATDKTGQMTLNMVVLDECGNYRSTEFEWMAFKKFRVLQLGDLIANEFHGPYLMGTFDNKGSTGALTYNKESMMSPTLRGKALDEIPFIFINTRDVTATPDEVPLLGLGKLNLAIYRGDADYRQTLFMQGQDTLVIIGGTRSPDGTPGEEDAIRTGAGSRIDVDLGGDAKYIGIESSGLSEQRESLQNDRQAAELKSGSLIPAKNAQESGEALKTRVTAQTASLTDIAHTAAKGLENVLKVIARWMQLDDTKVKVTPNTEFGEFPLVAKDILDLMSARTMGAPISKASVHEIMFKRGFTNKTFEEEMELIKEEDAEMPRTGQGATTLTADEQLAAQEADRNNAQANANADRELASKAQQQSARMKQSKK